MESSFRRIWIKDFFKPKFTYYDFLVVIFLLFTIWSVDHPVSIRSWLIEFSLIPIFVILMFIAGYYFKLSKFSCTLITVYLVLPLIGAHYTISGVPLGTTIGHLFNTTRNDYDRLVHFGFGFLMFYPIQETLVRFTQIKSFWKYLLPFSIVGMFSAVYEIFEWLMSLNFNKKVAAAFLGTQGDVWDSQKDMLVALIGCLLAILISLILIKISKNKQQDDHRSTLTN